MSIFLFRLAGGIARRRGTVLAIWFLLLVAAVGGAGALGDKYDDSVAIPGTESQQGQDVLSDRFGLTGANGQLLHHRHHGSDHRQGELGDRRADRQEDDRRLGRQRQQPALRRRPGASPRTRPRPSRSCASPPRSPRAHPRRRGRRGRAPEGIDRHHLRGRGRLQDDRRPEQGARAAGPAGLVPDPRHHLRCAAARRHADPDLADRRRRDAQLGGAGLLAGDRVEQRADARRDARAGRRHRLRAVHPVPLPTAPRRGTLAHRVDVARPRHRRERGRLRRSHGGDRARRALRRRTSRS